MADHWKSTPSYWCKFCSQYVRDTPIERKNHEFTGRHQGNIQRSLRELHKNKAREDRDKQRAKDEVARLNSLVSGEKKPAGDGASKSGPPPSGPAPVQRTAAQQRKAHAEQLAAMGVKLPEELQREVSGVGGWQTVSEKVLEPGTDMGSLAGILKREGREEEESKKGILSKGVHKRKAEDEEAEGGGGGEVGRKRKVWGSSLKNYPGQERDEGEDGEDLDALLSGIGGKKTARVNEDHVGEGERPMTRESGDGVKPEDSTEPESKPLDDVPPPVVFKKRKVKK